jgi:hypothetical protein
MRTSIRWIAGLLAGVIWFGGTVGVALAADGYGTVAGQQARDSSRGGLPFTGVDLLTFVLVAAAIIASGVALRAVATRHSRV